MTLVEIFKEIGHFGEDIGCNDKGGQHSYLETYDKLFLPLKHGCTFMEIGLAMGDSMKMWSRYFKNSEIIGVDKSIVFEYKHLIGIDKNRNKVRFWEADATRSGIVDYCNETAQPDFDIIIDDASHMENDQVATFNLLKHKMNKGGLYIIEDILSLDTNRKRFESLHDNCEIVDLRKVKGRFDDVLVIYRDF